MDTPVDHPPQSDPASVTPMLRTVVLADLADSTDFIQRLGDAPAAAFLQRLDLQIRDLLVFTNGRLIDKADGLLALFERPVQAVDFALRYQHALRDLSSDVGIELKARIGIHVGDVMTWVNTPQAVAAGAKPLEVEGLAKPVAARLMSLAMPGQILMSGMAQTLAHRAQSELGDRASKLRWLVHGRYRFKGVPAPMIVHEVGEAGFSPLRLPPSGQKSWREVPLWRRPPVLAIELICVVGVLGGTLYTTLRSPPALAFGERDWVVVGDLNNFTGDARLEDSLEDAMRISLQQSSYVNLLPNLQVADTLGRMGRKPGAQVDRSVGSEIALREGAKALILPTVTEVGGKLRVNLEVVDPETQATVYTKSAEGKGIDSILASIDAVNRDLRLDLGEAIKDVDSQSRPLAKVTTPSLDALRAYSLAQDAHVAGNLKEAMALDEEAIKIDPGFAMAYISLARIKLSFGDDAAFYALAKKADGLRERLTRRESLLLDARLAMHDAPAASLAKWDLLTKIYPDEYTGYYNYALVSWYNGYQLDKALTKLAPATSTKNPTRASAMFVTGVLQLARNRYDEAVASFKLHESLTKGGYNRQYAETYAAKRNFDEAQRVIARQVSSGSDYTDLAARADDVLFPLDKGQWQAGLDQLRQHITLAEKISPDRVRTNTGSLLALRAFAPDKTLRADLRGFVSSQQTAMAQSTPLVRRHDMFLALMAGVSAVQTGDAETGRTVLASFGREAVSGGYPWLNDAAAMLEAALATERGAPNEAIARLLPLHDGTELYASHSVLMRAYAAAKRFDDAGREAEWLAANRGMAYGEYNSDYALTPTNVAQSNLAWLSGAEYALSAGENEVARKRLAAFRAAWANAQELPFLRARLSKLESALALTSPGSKKTGPG